MIKYFVSINVEKALIFKLITTFLIEVLIRCLHFTKRYQNQ